MCVHRNNWKLFQQLYKRKINFATEKFKPTQREAKMRKRPVAVIQSVELNGHLAIKNGRNAR